MQPLKVFITENFDDGEGKEQTRYTYVGNLVPHEKGQGANIYIKPGLSIGGKLACFPPRSKDDTSSEE